MLELDKLPIDLALSSDSWPEDSPEGITILSSQSHRSKLLQDLTEARSFIAQRTVELGLKDYGAFSLFEGNEVVRDWDNIEFYEAAEAILKEAEDQILSQDILNLLALFNSPKLNVDRILQELNAPKILVSQFEEELVETEMRIRESKK